MKIILSNYRYFISGGPERYLFSIKEILERKGHIIIPFSVDYEKNLKTKYKKYFMSPIGENIYFDKNDKRILHLIKTLERQIYSIEGFVKSKKMALDTKADMVYLLHFLNKMSPSIIDGFKKYNLPIITRISDFGIICPNGHLFHREKICEECLTNGFLNAVNNRCIKKSFVGSLIKSSALKFHYLNKNFQKIDAFVFPSKFTLNKYKYAGFDKKNMYYIPTFIDTNEYKQTYDSQNYLLYFGRIVEEKGVHFLLNAYRKIRGDKPQLYVVGNNNDNDYSKNIVDTFKDEVKFFPFLSKNSLKEIINNSIAVIIPSLWYDNLPNVMLEAYASGKPVIAPNHGCFSEFVDNEKTGMLYNPDNILELSYLLEWTYKNTNKLKEMGKAGYQYVINNHSPYEHYRKLIKLFKQFQ